MYFERIILFASLLTASTVSASCLHIPALHKRQSSNAVPISNFGYTELQGPLNWAGIQANYSACATSSVQSPININGSIPFLKSTINVNIPDVSGATMNNIGTHVEVITNGTATVDGASYQLVQFHFHTPSEHRINNEYYPVEVHVVWLATNATNPPAVGSFLVTTLLLEISATSTTPLIDGVTQNIADIQNPGTTTKTGNLQFAHVLDFIRTTQFYEYTGSLTTPPCAPGLRIHVASQQLPISPGNYLALKKVLKFNSRYTQNAVGQPNLLMVAANDINANGNSGTKSSSKSGASGASLIPVPLSLLSFVLAYVWL